MYARFHTDSSVTKTGFKAMYKIGEEFEVSNSEQALSVWLCVYMCAFVFGGGCSFSVCVWLFVCVCGLCVCVRVCVCIYAYHNDCTVFVPENHKNLWKVSESPGFCHA